MDDEALAFYRSGQERAAALDFEKAADFFRASVLVKKSPHAMHNLGACLHRLGFVDEALRAYEWANELNPSYDKPLVAISIVLAEVGRLDESLLAAERAIALCPSSRAAMINMGAILKAVGRLEESVHWFDRVEPGAALTPQPSFAAIEADSFGTITDPDFTPLDRANPPS